MNAPSPVSLGPIRSPAPSGVLLTLLLALSAGGHAAWAGSPWYQVGEEGWFWYAEDPLAEEEEALEQVAEARMPEPEPAVATAPAAPAAGPAMFSAAWMRDNLPLYLDRAIDEPTQENVEAFLYLQRLSMDRAERFSGAVARAVVRDPLLDEVSRAPTAPFAANLRSAAIAENTREALARVATQAGLFFVYDSTCIYCQAQAPLLREFADQTGFVVYAVSVDGRPLPDGSFPDWRADNGIAEALEVVSCPAIFLAVPPDTYVNIAQGAISLVDLRARVLQAAVLAGLETEEGYQAIQMLPTLAREAALDEAQLNTIAEDPAAVARVLRQQMRRTQ